VKHPQRDHVLKNLATQLGLSQAPQAIPVPLDWDQCDPNTPSLMKSTTVYWFPFEEQLHGILNNPSIMQISHIFVNQDNPFSCYIPNEYIEEVQDGWNYQCLLDYLDRGINTPGVNLFIIGLLIYVKKTHTDGKGRFCLEPVIALLTLLNFDTHAQFVSQICLGYINDLDLSSTAHKTTSGKNGKCIVKSTGQVTLAV
jgi:hypothetical protein